MGFTKRAKLVKRAPAKKGRRPREVYIALLKLQNAARYVEAHAAELQESIRDFRERERESFLKELLETLRNSSRGDLLKRKTVIAREDETHGEGSDLLEVLTDAFALRPISKLAEIIEVKDGIIPVNVVLDRPLNGETCKAIKIEAVGWSYKGKVLLPRIASPVY